MQQNIHNRRGFTMVQLLVTAAIIVILIGLIAPAILRAREAARSSTCRNNLKQFGIALHNYHETWDVFPPGWMPRHPADESGADSWAWSVMLLPYMD